MRKTLLVAVLATAGCATSGRVPADVAELARQTQNGGKFVLEIAADGSIWAAEAQVSPQDVPAACREAADRAAPGGEVVEAELEMAGGKRYYEIVKVVDGRRIEFLMTADGTIAGREDALREGEYPESIVAAARAAAGEGELVAVESVSGPEAQTGESYHVKIRQGGEVLRVSVREDGTVVRTMRKMTAEMRVPK